MIKAIKKFTSKINKLQGNFSGILTLSQRSFFTMNTSQFIKFNHSIVKIHSCMFSNSERDSYSVDIKALHEAARKRNYTPFLGLIPLLLREKSTLKIADILEGNLVMKNYQNRLDLILPILTQAFGAGKTHFIKNLPLLIEKYCPEHEELKESYHIYVNLKELVSGPDNMEDKLNSHIFSSFLNKYGAKPKKFPTGMSISSLQDLATFITGECIPGEFEEVLRQLRVNEDKIDLIVKDFKDKKYTYIILGIDELGAVERSKFYSIEDEKKILKTFHSNKEDTYMDINDFEKLMRLYYFWDILSNFMRIPYFEVIASGKGISCLLGKNIASEGLSPFGISQIILEPLRKEDVKILIEEVLVKSNMIKKDFNLTTLTQEIYNLTAGHPFYVALCIYFYYLSVMKNDTDFNLEMTLKDAHPVKNHIDELIKNVKMYKGCLGLKEFFYDIVNGKEMNKGSRHEITSNKDSYIGTIELLDNLGISYSNGKTSIIKPIIPGIFKVEFDAAVLNNYKMGPQEEGLYQEKLFESAFRNFARKLYENPDNKNNIDPKRMFCFLRKFPEFNASTNFIDKILSIPKVTNQKKSEFDEESDYTELQTINPLNVSKLLEKLKENILYKHRESSSSSDYAYVRRINKNKKLFFFFQIKSAVEVNLEKEYEKVFIQTELKLKEDCLYRLIIFNAKDENTITFQENEAYKVYYYEKGEIKQLLKNYNEMNRKALMYYVNPKEYENFKLIKDASIKPGKK